jgi:hypothetical protein
MKTLLLLLTLTVSAFAQDLPEYRTLADLSGRTRVYVEADAASRKAIAEKLKKQFTIVDVPENAEFFILFKVTNTERITSLDIPFDTGEMFAYYMDGKRRIITWSHSTSAESRKLPSKLVNVFIKAWRKQFPSPGET